MNTVMIFTLLACPEYFREKVKQFLACNINGAKSPDPRSVYDSDPEKNPNAQKFKRISFQEAYEKELKIMDLTAFSLCMENNIPILVFDMNTKGNLRRIIDGEEIGSIIE